MTHLKEAGIVIAVSGLVILLFAAAAKYERLQITQHVLPTVNTPCIDGPKEVKEKVKEKIQE